MAKFSASFSGESDLKDADIYMRAYGGRVARLQAIYADAARAEPRGRAGREGDLGEAWRLAKDWRQAQGDHGGPASAADWASERIGENVHDTIPEDLEGEVGDEIPEESGSATDGDTEQ